MLVNGSIHLLVHYWVCPSAEPFWTVFHEPPSPSFWTSSMDAPKGKLSDLWMAAAVAARISCLLSEGGLDLKGSIVDQTIAQWQNKGRFVCLSWQAWPNCDNPSLLRCPFHFRVCRVLREQNRPHPSNWEFGHQKLHTDMSKKLKDRLRDPALSLTT